MKSSKSFHLVYIPGDLTIGVKDQVISLIATNNPHDVLLRTASVPESVAMELQAQDTQEVKQELRELGFVS